MYTYVNILIKSMHNMYCMSNNYRKEIIGINIDKFSENHSISRSATIKLTCNNFPDLRDIKEFYSKTGLSRNKTTEFLLSKIKELYAKINDKEGSNYE